MHYRNTAAPSILSCYVLACFPTAVAGRYILHLITEHKGKISCLAGGRGSHMQSPPLPLDFAEVALQERKKFSPSSSHSVYEKKENYSETLHSATSYTVLESYYSAIPEGKGEQESNYQRTYKRALMLGSDILRQFLMEGSSNPEVWSLLSTLLPLSRSFHDPKAIPLLIASVFLHQEGIEQAELEKIAKSLPSHREEQILRDIHLLLEGGSQDITSHIFDKETVDIMCDVLGIYKRSRQR